jgi:dTDP-4-dehydrorhamnose reductase
MTSGRRLLILGGTGFLGVHVARAGLALGWDVAVASREPRLPATSGTDFVRTRTFDALVQGTLTRLLDAEQPTAVVVCAALPTIAQCEAYPVLARKLNVDLPADVARWTHEHGARTVFVSTDLVFGAEPPRDARYREDDPPSPASEYGRTKAAGESAVLDADPRSVVARCALLHGDSFGRALGASDSLLAAVARGERPALFTDEWRTPLDVATAARALVRLAEHDFHGTVHVAGGERLSRLDLGLRVLAAAGKPNPSELLRATTRAAGGFASRPADVSLDTTKLRAILGSRWETSE